jgi:hypothetical protein
VAGSELRIELTVTNRSAEDAYEVKLTEGIPSTVTLLGISSSQGVCEVQGNVITCQMGFLPKHSQARVQLVMRPSVGGWMTNVASVVAADETELTDN